MHRIVNSAYAGAPIWTQNLTISVAGWRKKRQRYGGVFNEILDESLERTYASREELVAYQKKRWDSAILPILDQLPTYRDLDCSFEKISQLPILTKEELRRRIDDFRNPGWKTHKPIRMHTSGTTGAGLQFLLPAQSIQRQWAYWWRYRYWHGIYMNEWCGVFGGREIVPANQTEPPFWRIDHARRTVLFSQYHISPERGVRFLEEIASRQLQWLHGYPSILALIAKMGIEAGLAGTIPVKWITLGAEKLLTHQRQAIEKMFNVSPLQHFGQAEAVANISECEEGRLHVDEDFSIVEFISIPDERDSYRLIGSSLDNQAMPFIRYDTNDIVRLAAADECPCGRNGRVVREIDGRQEDFIVLSDNSMVGRLDHLFKDATNVVEAQIAQIEKGKATYRIVRGVNFTHRDEDDLREASFLRFGKRLDIEFEYLGKIPRTPRGKLQLVLNEMPVGQFEYSTKNI